MLHPLLDVSSGDTGWTERTIKEGDLVIVYEGPEKMKAVYVNSKDQFQNKFGVFKHADWIGVPFGSKVLEKGGRGTGFVYLLAPNPELWTQVLPHRTQILYLADISLIVSLLELRPGSIALESGTGSGSLSTSLARAVQPTGHVYTFEYHQVRSETARNEFRKNNLDGLITVTERDIQGDGFPEEFVGRADAVFLDLPGPWMAVPSAARSLCPDGWFCSFSPCMEQVQKTCEALQENGFTDFRTVEMLLRQYDIRQEYFFSNLGDEEIDFAKPPMAKKARENRPHLSYKTYIKAKRELENQKKGGVNLDADPSNTEEEGGKEEEEKESKREEKVHVAAKPSGSTRGHTGYLTFARKSL